MLAQLRESTYEQDIHSNCKDQSKQASLSIKAVSNGVADYMVINAYEFAFSDSNEIYEFATMLHNFMEHNCAKED